MEEPNVRKRRSGMLCSKKEIILSRSLGSANFNERKSSVRNGTDSVAATILAPVPVSLLSYTEQDRKRDEDILNRFDREIGWMDNGTAMAEPAKVEVPKKRKSSRMAVTNDSNAALPTTETNAMDINLSSIENHNARLRSKGTVSDILVSKSSRTSPARRRVKNTIPSDNFEKYLASLGKRYPPMNERDRVLFWKFDPGQADEENSCIDNYSEPTELLLNSQKMIEKICETSTNCKASIRNVWPSSLNMLGLNSVDTPKADFEEILSRSLNLHSYETLVKREPSRRVYGNAWQIKQQKTPSKGSADSMFKIPVNPDASNQPVKLIASKPETSTAQKEEFYKYLGLETASPNGRNKQSNVKVATKRRSLRVRQKQIQEEKSRRAKQRRLASPISEIKKKCSTLELNKETNEEKPASDPTVLPSTEIISTKISENIEDRLQSENSRSLTSNVQRRNCGPVVRYKHYRRPESPKSTTLCIIDRIDYAKSAEKSDSAANASKNSISKVSKRNILPELESRLFPKHKLAGSDIPNAIRRSKRKCCNRNFANLFKRKYRGRRPKTLSTKELDVNISKDVEVQKTEQIIENHSDIIDVLRKCQAKVLQSKVPEVISCMERIDYEKPAIIPEIVEKFSTLEASVKSVPLELSIASCPLEEKASDKFVGTGCSDGSLRQSLISDDHLNSPSEKNLDEFSGKELNSISSVQSSLYGFDNGSVDNLEILSFSAKNSRPTTPWSRAVSPGIDIESLSSDHKPCFPIESANEVREEFAHTATGLAETNVVEDQMSNTINTTNVCVPVPSGSLGPDHKLPAELLNPTQESPISLSGCDMTKEPNKQSPNKSNRSKLKLKSKFSARLIRTLLMNQRFLRPRVTRIIRVPMLKDRVVNPADVTSTTDGFSLHNTLKQPIVETASVGVVETECPAVGTEELNVKDFHDDETQEAQEETPSVGIADRNILLNPLQESNGAVLHGFYELDYLIVVQEKKVSFWKYSQVMIMLGVRQEWEMLGNRDRLMNDMEITSPYKNRLCINDNNPVYVEMRAKQFPADKFRACNMASVYVNIYYFDDLKNVVVFHSVNLETVRCVYTQIAYTTIPNTRDFIMCWQPENNINTIRTSLCRYCLTYDLNNLDTTYEFNTLDYIASSIQCIGEDKLIGFGGMKATIWEHNTGDILANLDMQCIAGDDLQSILCTFELQNYLIVYHCKVDEINNTPQLVISAANMLLRPYEFRTIQKHDLPSEFAKIKGAVNTDDLIIVTPTESSSELLMLKYQPHQLFFKKMIDQPHIDRFYSTGSQYFVEISTESLTVKNIYEILIDFVK